VSARMHLPSGLVTFLFTDIEGSTRLAQMLGTGYRGMLTEHRRLLRRTLVESGGSPLFTEGDSFFAAFADARSALVGCARAQRALTEHAWTDAKPLVRMGLHTGDAHPEDGEYTTPVVHRAARIAAAAHGGQVLCSAATATLAGGTDESTWLLDLGLHRLRGFDDRERLYQLVSPGLPRHFPRPRTAAESQHNLPAPVTRFVGRDTECAELAGLLRQNRLVSIVGVGGAGKTRLAVETAGTGRYPDGTWYVDLAAADDVPAATAAALGLRPEPGRPILDTLLDALANRRLLLVLDGCEHRPAATAALASRLLLAGRGVTILAASRQPLGLPGELVWRIPPLPLAPAVELLLDRAVAARGGRPVPDPEVVRLGEVAGRLDGLPLALELAAARLRVLSADELADRLDDPLSTLDSRLAESVESSYRTLDPDSARLLRQLAVFAGPVRLSTVEWYVGGNVVAPLATLVDRSLVSAEPGAAGTRYRLSDPVRGYAARRLVGSGEEPSARDRHVAWVRHAVGAHPVTLVALDPIAAEVRAALRWCATSGSARDGLRLVTALDEWWSERRRTDEARHWLGLLYERTDGVPDADLAVAYQLHARLGEADRYGPLAVDAARRAGEPGLLVRVLAGQASTEPACRAVLNLAHAYRVVPDGLAAVYRLAEILWRRGDLDEAAELLAAARPVERSRPGALGARTVDWLLGLVALRRGDLVGAHEHLVVALRSRLAYGLEVRAAQTLPGFAVRCALAGDHLAAARLFGAAAASGTTPDAYWTGWQDEVRGALGDVAFDSGYAEGSRLTLAEAAGIALAVEHPDLTEDSLRFTDA
jgi:predicted ATPase/class 3 adenylate cyclase